MVIKAHCCLMFVTGCDSYLNLVGLGFLSLFPPLHNKIPSVLDQIVFISCNFCESTGMFASLVLAVF